MCDRIQRFLALICLMGFTNSECINIPLPGSMLQRTNADLLAVATPLPISYNVQFRHEQALHFFKGRLASFPSSGLSCILSYFASPKKPAVCLMMHLITANCESAIPGSGHNKAISFLNVSFAIPRCVEIFYLFFWWGNKPIRHMSVYFPISLPSRQKLHGEPDFTLPFRLIN